MSMPLYNEPKKKPTMKPSSPGGSKPKKVPMTEKIMREALKNGKDPLKSGGKVPKKNLARTPKNVNPNKKMK